jgi:hypothetical protein
MKLLSSYRFRRNAAILQCQWPGDAWKIFWLGKGTPTPVVTQDELGYRLLYHGANPSCSTKGITPRTLWEPHIFCATPYDNVLGNSHTNIRNINQFHFKQGA